MHMGDKASSFFNSNNIVKTQARDQDPLLSKGEVERLGCLPFPSPATAGQIDKLLERGPQIRKSRTAYGIVYHDAPLLSHGETERLSAIPPPLQRPVDLISRKRPSNAPAVEDSFWDYQIKRTVISNSIQLGLPRKARAFETLTLP